MKLQDKSSSINTVTLKEMKGNYLKDLFTAAENEVIRETDKKKKNSI
jgi:DNA-binding protein YbaB